jgi:catechol 2,3-dioxygenase-like lactoylglutathione lyase family enzyme
MLRESNEEGVGMLGDKDAAATLAVSDLQRARDFYENTIGLTPVQEPPGGILYKSGNSVVLVYPSAYAGTNRPLPLPGESAMASTKSSRTSNRRVSHSSTTTCRTQRVRAMCT